MKSPIIKSDKKQDIITELFDSKTSEATRKFLKLLISSKREAILGAVAQQFILQYKNNKNIEVVHVKTAAPMSDDVRKQIPNLVKDALGSKADIEFVEEVDEELIGGIVIRLGDKQLDSSIKRRLLDLEREFSKNPYIKKY